MIYLIAGNCYGAGKDTVGGFIEEALIQCGRKPLIMHFADWVKDSLVRYKNWNGKKDDAGRHLMQHYATDTVRKELPDYWAETTIKLAVALQHEYTDFIIPDFRFPNEYQCAKEWFDDDVHTILVERDNVDTSSDTSKHSSETSLEEFDFDGYIENNVELDELRKIVFDYVLTLFNFNEVPNSQHLSFEGGKIHLFLDKTEYQYEKVALNRTGNKLKISINLKGE